MKTGCWSGVKEKQTERYVYQKQTAPRGSFFSDHQHNKVVNHAEIVALWRNGCNRFCFLSKDNQCLVPFWKRNQKIASFCWEWLESKISAWAVEPVWHSLRECSASEFTFGSIKMGTGCNRVALKVDMDLVGWWDWILLFIICKFSIWS